MNPEYPKIIAEGRRQRRAGIAAFLMIVALGVILGIMAVLAYHATQSAAMLGDPADLVCREESPPITISSWEMGKMVQVEFEVEQYAPYLGHSTVYAVYSAGIRITEDEDDSETTE